MRRVINFSSTADEQENVDHTKPNVSEVGILEHSSVASKKDDQPVDADPPNNKKRL